MVEFGIICIYVRNFNVILSYFHVSLIIFNFFFIIVSVLVNLDAHQLIPWSSKVNAR